MTETETAGARPGPGRWKAARAVFAFTATAVVLGHLYLVSYFDFPVVTFSPESLSGGDFDLHFRQALRVIEGLEGWGKTWVYDPRADAGYPIGALTDADNKAWELLTYALWKLGMPMGAAFNCFLLLAHVLVLPVVFLTARLFGLGRWAALLAAAMGSALWFFDSFCHWWWWIGTVAYPLAAYLSLLPLAFFYRFLEERRYRYAIPAAALLALVHLIHPYSFLILVLPMAALYARSFRRLSRNEHAAVVAIGLAAPALNAYWLLVAFSFWHHILDSGFFCNAHLGYLLADFFGILLDTTTTGGIGTRTGFRFLSLGAALAMLLLWRRSGDRRFLPFAVGLGAMLGLTYLGGHLKPLAQIQPYRHIIPAVFLALIPAAALLERAWESLRRVRPPRYLYIAVAVVAIPGLQHLGRDVIYFFPWELPLVPASIEDLLPGLSATGYPVHYAYRHYPVYVTERKLAHWVRTHDDGSGRFLVRFGAVGEYLGWNTNAEILGGFRFRNLAHAYANLFRPRPQELEINTPERARAYLETYAVKWVILTLADPLPDVFADHVEPYLKIGIHQILRTKIKADLFQKGSGRVRSSTNRIEVSQTDPGQDIVLKYNWLETLVCEPGCSVQRSRTDLGTVGFIRVPAPHPASFVIRNAY